MIYLDANHKLNLSKLHEPQKEFVRSQALHTGLIGGYQSGKSVAGVVKVITKLLISPGIPIAYYLPTYRLINDMLVPKFEASFDTLGIGYKFLKHEGCMLTPYGKIMMRSLDNPDSIVSYSVGYSLVDEFDVVHADKMAVAIGRINSRNSLKHAGVNSVDFVSTPEGFGFAHKFFVKKHNGNKKLIKISTLDNAHNLADSYIQGLREAYTDEQLRAYLSGEFVNLFSGTVYYRFDRHDNHTDDTVQPGDKLFLGMDFNVGHMAAVVHVVRNGQPRAVDEFHDIYDTASMIEAVRGRYPGHEVVVKDASDKGYDTTIYPDAAGQARSTSGVSDVVMLKGAKFRVIVPKANPPVKDRITAMNMGFLDNAGNRNYLVNTDMCPNYTEALEQLVYKNGIPDKSSGLDHITDGAGYYIYRRFGFKKQRRGPR